MNIFTVQDRSKTEISAKTDPRPETGPDRTGPVSTPDPTDRTNIVLLQLSWTLVWLRPWLVLDWA